MIQDLFIQDFYIFYVWQNDDKNWCIIFMLLYILIFFFFFVWIYEISLYSNGKSIWKCFRLFFFFYSLFSQLSFVIHISINIKASPTCSFTITLHSITWALTKLNFTIETQSIIFEPLTSNSKWNWY